MIACAFYAKNTIELSVFLKGGDFLMTDAGKNARNEYYRKYREKNRDRVNQLHREWSRKHPERIKEYNDAHWDKIGKQNEENT